MKKTTKMKYLLETANTMLLNPNLTQETKKGVALLIEAALHHCDVYSGYNNYIRCTDQDGHRSLGPKDVGYEEWTRIYYAPKGGF